METIICGRCATACDPDDNFCRHCGMALQEQQLPSVPNGIYTPAVWRPRVPAVVMRGAAFVAAGTLAEVLARRLLRRALGRLGRGPRVPARRTRGEVAPAGELDLEDAQVASDTLLLRRVRIRR